MALQIHKSGCFEYGVFLSFCGKDTRNNFTGLFHRMLEQHGIRAYFDEEDLPKGGRINEILEAISKSQILVPIFSQRYAESKWCLREVAKMVECAGSGQQRLIIPIFFGVDPTHVRHQTGPFGDAFKKHQKKNRGEVDGWRRALRNVGGISGYDLEGCYKGNQTQLVDSIVDQIQKVLATNRILHEEEYLVGVDVRVDEITNRLDFEAEGVRMIGIHGIGGIGKTTLAKAIYNRSRHLFQATCFIENVREVSKSSKGLVKPQQQLIRDISKDPKRKIDNPSQGIEMIEDMVSRKRVLLILDDVDDQTQLNNLAGDIRLFHFHSGSRVIVTTRQKKILEGLQDEAVYSLEGLVETDALELFNHHAFGADGPQEEYINLIEEVVSISKRVPLALQVFGALFKTATTREEWEELVEELRYRQNCEIHNKLKICYESLNGEEKLIFLDIACLLVGKNSEEAIYVWEDLKLSPRQTLRSLQNKSLIKISRGKKFEMHDLIRDMGREIVLSENLLHPARTCRLWRKEDVEEASAMSQGNEIQGIILNLREGSEIEFSTQALVLMAQLRVLLINFSIFKKDCDFMHFPANLKWLEWKGCPLGELPLESKFKGILVLNLSHSFISQLWKETTKESSSRPTKEMFNCLKVLDLSCCECLKVTSNFSVAPNLVKLILDECSNLKEVDDSIAALKELAFLSMKGCVSLEKLPSKIHELSSLKVFNLEGCSKLVAFPQCPQTISTNGLFNLRQLILRGCECLEFVPQLHQFQSLRSLDMDGCRSLDRTRDRLFEDEVADIEWDELSMSETQTPGYWKEEFSFMLPCGSVNDPLLLKQLLCHSYYEPIDNGTLRLRVRYEDIANGDWVETIREVHCDYTFGVDNIYDCTVPLPWDDKVSEAPKRTSIKMKVRTASKHLLTKVDVKLQKRSKFSGQNVKPFISVSRKSTSSRPEFFVFISPHEEYKHDVIEYSRELNDRIDELRRLDVQVREERPLFGWRIEELVILSLILSDVEVSWYEQWPGTTLPRQASEKVFDKMKVLNLAQCKFLVKTPDFARTPHLETLILDHCECLEEIGESIGQLKKLARLSIVGCTKLPTLLFDILQSNSLLVLNFSKCTQFISILPEARMTDVSSDDLRERILGYCNSLPKLPECVGGLNSLRRLSLSGCHYSIKQLPDCLVTLEELILDDCTLLRELPECVGELKSLGRLSLRGCRSLKQLPDSIDCLVALEELILDDCTSLRKLPKCVGGLKSLRRLPLRGCRSLKQLPDSIDCLLALEELILDDCTSLRKLPKCVGGLKSLRRLSLRGCRSLKRLPDSIDCLVALEDCGLLGSLPDCVGRLQGSNQLSIRGCRSLKQLPDSVGSLKTLEGLNLDGCFSLERLPDCVGRLHSLRRLYLSGCHSLNQLPDSIECLVHLEELMLNNCHYLARLPDSIGKLKRLIKMQATRCPLLKSMPDLANLTALEELNVEGCTNLITIPGLQHLRSLKVLRMLHSPCLDLISLCLQLEGAACSHLQALSISTQYDDDVDKMQIPCPPLDLESLTLYGRIGAADVFMIKVGEESVGNFKGPTITFTEDDEINKRLRVLARDDASPRFRTLTICSPPGISMLRRAHILFHRSLTSESSKSEFCQGRRQYDDDFCCSTNKRLKQLPDSVECLETLEELILDDCVSLERLPHYVGRLQSLRVLYVRSCRSVKHLPDSVGSLKTLQELNLDCCVSLERLPDCVGRLHSLRRLYMRGCRLVKQLPDSVGSLETLEEIKLDYCDSLERLPDCVGRLQSLRLLYIRSCPFLTQLPDSVGSLETLEEFMLDDCHYLARLPDSIGNLKRLTTMVAIGCPSLKSMPDLQNLTALEELNVGGCTNLIRIPGLHNLRSLKVLHMHHCPVLDLRSVCLQLEGAAFPHLKEFGISKQYGVAVDTMHIPFPPLHLESFTLYGRTKRADVLEIKVGEESVGYFQGPVDGFGKDDEINKRLRVLAIATRDDASPRFKTLTICCPPDEGMLRGVRIRFGQSLTGARFIFHGRGRQLF